MRLPVILRKIKRQFQCFLDSWVPAVERGYCVPDGTARCSDGKFPVFHQSNFGHT